MSLPVSEVVLVPFMSSESVAFPPHIGFDLTSELVGHPAPGPLHGTGSKKMRVLQGGMNPWGEKRGKTMLTPEALVMSVFL